MTKNFLQKVGNNIEYFRLLKNKTIKEMALTLHLSNSGYRNIERGITEISLTKILHISGILNVGISELLEFDSSIEKNEDKSISKEVHDNLKLTLRHYEGEISFLRRQLQMMVDNEVK